MKYQKFPRTEKRRTNINNFINLVSRNGNKKRKKSIPGAINLLKKMPCPSPSLPPPPLFLSLCCVLSGLYINITKLYRNKNFLLLSSLQMTKGNTLIYYKISITTSLETEINQWGQRERERERERERALTTAVSARASEVVPPAGGSNGGQLRISGLVGFVLHPNQTPNLPRCRHPHLFFFNLFYLD